MEALQRVASGASGARDDLIAAVKRFGGIRRITNNLVAEYLRDLDDEALTAEVSKAVASMSEVAFGYRFPLKPPMIPGATQPPPTPALHRVWDAVMF